MQPRPYRPRILEVAVILAGVLVAIYAVSVIRDVGGPPPDEGASTLPQVAPREPTATPTPTAAPTAPPKIGPFRQVVADASTILVVGDSTGNDPGEWVDLWAQDLGADRQVTLHQWDVAAGQFAATPTVYGEGEPLAVWNLSYPAAQADYDQRLEDVPDQPDAVLLNVGHDRDVDTLAQLIQRTTRKIDRRWGSVPTAWILQNPSTGEAAKEQEAAVRFVRARATTEQVPVIDVDAAFRKAGPDALLIDGARPNAQGSRLWADTVGKVLRTTSG